MDIGSMNVLGLGSGMDLQGIIDKLVNVDKKPVMMKQMQKIQYESYYTAFDSLESKMSKLMGDASSMLTDLTLQTASVSDDSLADVSVTGAPESTVHNISVSSVAKGETWLSTSGESSLTNNVVSSSSGVFKYKIGTKEYSIDLDNNALSSTPTTLQEFVNAINSNGSGLRASTVYDGSGYVVILKTPEGTTNNLTIEQNDTNLEFGENGAPNEASSDASLTIDGVAVTSHSNTLADNLSGLKIMLKDTGDFTVSVNTDYSTLSEDMQNIVDDYNDMVKYIDTNSGYDSEKNIADAFFTNSTIRSVTSKLDSVFMSKYGDSDSSVSYLSNLGIDISKSGKMSFDGSAFLQALQNNFEDAKKMLSETKTGAEDGFLNVLHNTLYNFTKTNGDIELEKSSLKDRTDRLQSQIDIMNKQLEQERTTLTMTFAQMDEYMGALKSQSSYMEQIFNSTNSSKN
jgi:flagellar hook-associated protein 2